MNNRLYGYARVSSESQSLERQISALRGYGLEDRDIIYDKASGKDFNREGYQMLKSQLLRTGDTLVIKELDRLGRNYEQIKEEWNELLKMGIDIVILDTPILNTSNKSDLEKSLINNIIFELFSYLSEKERLKIRSRQEEGIRRARELGKHCGRPKTSIPSNFVQVYTEWKHGGITAKKAMELLSLKRTTFYNLVRIHEESQK